MRWRRLSLWLPAVVMALLVGCSLPQDIKTHAQQAKVDVNNVEVLLKSEQESFEVWKQSAEAEKFLGTINRENWSKRYFGDAQASVKVAQAQIASEIEPMLKRDSNDDREKLTHSAHAVQRTVVAVRKVLGDYKARRTALEAFVQKQGELIAAAESSIRDVKERVQAYSTAAGVAGKEFPERHSDLASLALGAVTLRDDGLANLAFVKSEVKQSDPDYGAVIDALSDIAKVEKDTQGYTTTQLSRLGELRRSYSKTLVDIRVDYYVVATRYSWDESSDLNTEIEYAYPPVKVDPQTYETFSVPKWEDEPVARRGWGRNVNSNIGESSWQKLGIDPWVDMPNSHDSAEYFADTSERYFHKYRIMEDGKVTYTDWVEVKEEMFDSVEDFLGMDLESKPLGFFAGEQLAIPAPEGMSYVGNPAYGSWKTEPGGSRFWEFYGQYAMMNNLLGGHRYSYSEWDDWNRNFRGKKPYFGQGDQEFYGSGGSVTSTRSHYANSNYFRTEWPPASRQTSQGGMTGMQRGSGANFRGGGPGGGGK